MIHNLRINSNRHYFIVLLNVGLPSMDNKAMTWYLFYKYKLPKMRKEGLLIIAPNIRKSHLMLKREYTRYATSLLIYWDSKRGYSS